MTTSSQLASHLLRSRLGKICVAITGATPTEMLQTASEVLQESSFIEFRLDYLAKPAAALPDLKQFLADHGAVTAIATCRCEENGGKFHGSSQQSLDILLQAAASGFALVDIELESVEKLGEGTMDQLRAAGAAVIVSFHDFGKTGNLDAVLKRMEPFAPDFLKVVPTAQTLSDNVTLMRFLAAAKERGNDNLVGICMGEAGIPSRILGPRVGSAFTFASAHVGGETAPGQITARTLIETFRVDQVDASTKIYGVAGSPISSSLSPLMMNTAFRRETVNAVYLALPAKKADDLFTLVREVPMQGLSVTMPLKQEIMPLLARTDALSAKIGAVNTVARMPDGKFYGFNTDVAGIVGPLERRLSLKGAKVLVLGAGGAARAAVFGCRDKGAEVSILNRTPETAQKLAKQSGAKIIKREAVAKSAFDVIINATPVGMAGNKAAQLLGPEDLHARIVFDLVYNPIETPLLQMARARGLTAISGVEMFVQQGARQFEIWTGKPAPEEEMLRVVLHALRPQVEPGKENTGPAPTAPVQAPAAPPPAPKPHSEPVAVKPPPAAPAKAAPAKTAPMKAAPPVKAAAKTSAKPAPPAKVPVKAPAKVPAKPPLKTAGKASAESAAKKAPAKAAKKATRSR